MELAKRVWDSSTRLDLLHDGDRVLIGVSGGPDSLCLLEVLHRLAARHRLELHVAHLNHGLRPEAGADADFVRAEAERRGCGFIAETVDVQAAARTKKQSLETAARGLRYDFLKRAAQHAGASLVAVAHTADDQAETMLMRLLRGTGLRGLRGMLPKRVMSEWVIGSWDAADGQLPITIYPLPVYVIRPLLHIPRSDILAYCAEHNLNPRVDSSNSDVRYLRNRVRHELLPTMEAYNPKLRVILARMAEAAAGDYEIWLGAVQGLWKETARPSESGDGDARFDRQRWLALGQAQQRALLRAAVAHLAGDWDEIDFEPIDAAAAFSRQAAPGRSCQVAAGLVLKVEAEDVTLAYEPIAPEQSDWPRVEQGALAPGWRLVIEPLGPGAWRRDELEAAPRWIAHVDADRLHGPPAVRARRAGDRFQPLGMQGHTVKLSDYLVNRKIPVELRDQWPLLACGDDIVWVAGLRLDERYKVTDGTRSVTRLTLSRAEEE
jgi:tRNA(Ile)-lysidine synthase